MRYHVGSLGQAPVVRDMLLSNGMSATNGRDWLVQWSGPGLRDMAYQALFKAAFRGCRGDERVPAGEPLPGVHGANEERSPLVELPRHGGMPFCLKGTF